MNKFFRLVSMFAIAGVTFAYTSCTDYSEDINKVDNRVDNVEGRLTTVEGQVKNLETTTTQLKDAQAKTDAAVKTLETTLKELQTKHDKDIADLQKAYADADAALKTEIQGKIDALKQTHSDDVKNINSAIDALRKDVTTLQEKAAAVEALIPTLATKKDLEEVSNKTAEAIAEVNKTIGALQGNLETAQKAIAALEGRVSTLEGDVAGLKTAVEKAQKAADDAQTAADKAQSDATLALGNIEALKKALGKYAEVGALESKIAALEKMDSTLQADKFDTEKFGTFFAKELKDVIGAYAEKGVLEAKLDALDGKDEDLQDQITKLDAKVEQYNTALNDRITKLDEKVEQYKAELDARIDAVLGIIADRLSSIALVPQYYYDGVPAILFETIAYDPLADDKENVEAAAPSHIGDQNSRLVNQFKNYTSAESVAQFRLNPRTVGVDCADFSLVGDKADYVFTRAAAPAAPVSIVGTPSYDPKTGYATFKVKKNEKINTDKNENKNLDIVALKAVLKKGLTDAEKEADAKPEVYSEFVHVNEIAYTADQLAISDKAKLAGKKADHEYAKTFDEATKNAYVYKMPYDTLFNLKALVATCINSEIFTSGLEAKLDHEALDLKKYDLHYEFSVAQTEYPVTSGSTTTDQQTVIKCVDRLGGIFKVMDAKGVEYNKEAIGRTPIVRVDLMHGENIVTRAFIKLVISVKKASDNISIMDKVENFVVECPDTPVTTMKYDVEKLRKDLYRVLNISHVDFWNLYDVEKAYVKKNGKDLAAFPVPKLVDGPAVEGEATKEVWWEFTHGDVGMIGQGAKVEGYLVLKNKFDLYSEYPTTVTFKFTADFRLPIKGQEIKVTANIKNIFWETSGDNSVLQANVNVPASETDVAANCYFMTPIAEQPWEELSVTGLPCDETPAFRIAKVYKDGEASNAPVAGIYLTTPATTGELSITLDKGNADIKKALNSEHGLQAVIEWYAVGKSGDEYVLHTFWVNFKRPVNLNFPDDIHVKDAQTGGDEITYGFAGLLTDWRGETILPPTPIEIHEEGYHWVKACSPADHAVVFPGYQKVVKEGHYEFEFEDKEVVIPTSTAYHKASIKLYDNADLQGWYARHGDQDRAFEWVGVFPKLVWRPAGTWVEKTTVVGYGRSEGEALENARVEANKLSPRYLENVETRGWKSDAPVTEVLNSGTVTVTFKTIKNVTYVPAVYETVEPTIEYSPCNPKPGPSSDVYTEGQRIGCWQWQKWATVTPGMTPGRFWNFYGVFKPADDVVLHLERNPDGSYKHVTTDLPDGKLPSKATLTQTPGYKLFYDNVLSPIQYTYHIYIPASIEYGWGVLNQTLVITVDPYNK